MDDLREDTLNAMIEDLGVKLLKHRDELLDTLKELEKQKMILSHFDEILKDWTSMVETQHIILNGIQQQKLANSIEVIGLPEEYAKDLEGVARILSRLLHIRIDESNIAGFKRMGDVDNIDLEDGTGNPRTLVVHLTDQNIKKRILTVSEFVVLSIVGSDRPMYITEHLTSRNHELLNKTRHEALRNHINNVWVENGKILVRRSDVSLIYEIKCDADIKNMAHY